MDLKHVSYRLPIESVRIIQAGAKANNVSQTDFIKAIIDRHYVSSRLQIVNQSKKSKFLKGRNMTITKFDISPQIFGNNRGKVSECVAYYEEEEFEKQGWILDLETEEVVQVIDRKIILNIGDIVDFEFDLWKVVQKTYDVQKDMYIYRLKFI